MSKKTTVILIIVVAVLVLILGIFLLFFTSPPIQKSTNVQSNYSPFGNYGGSSSTTPVTSNNPAPTNDQIAPAYLNNNASPLIKISTAPIAGAEVFNKKLTGTTTTSIVRYTERATGHTMDFDRSTNMLSNTSNTTIPTIYQAWWSGNALLAQFIGQTRDLIKTFTGTLPTLPATSTITVGPAQITGGFLADNIYALAISPKGNRVFYIPKGDTAQGIVSNLDGTKKTLVLNFPFNEWNAQWPSESTIALTSRPSYNAAGYLYFLSASTGSMTKVFGNILGLNTLTNPSLTYVLYSGSANNAIGTSIYDIKKGTSLGFTNVATLAEKCVWSNLVKTTAYCAVPSSVPIGNYPDDWYQGNVSFVDNIYKVDLTLPAVQLLYKLPTNQSIDAANLFLDAKEENLYFTNKSDYYLWGLTVKDLSPIGQ